MKKIRNVIILGLIFFSWVKVAHADVTSIRKNDIAQNVIVEVKKGENIKLIKMGQFVDDTGFPVYSLDPLREIQDEYDVLTSFDPEQYNLSKELYKEISDIMYFGLFHDNRSSHNWYIATQVLIWKTILGDNGQISFAPEVNESLVTTLEEYMNIIKENVTDFQNLVYPSFANQNNLEQKIKCKVNNDVVLVDDNHVLENFKVEFDDRFVSVRTSNNTLTASFTNSGSWQVKLFPKKYNKTGLEIKGYVADNNLAFLRRGELNNLTMSFEVKLNNISFTAKDSETGQNVYGGIYQGYKKTSPGGFRFMMEKDKEVLDLVAADYYIKEIETPYGYQPLTEEKHANLFDKDLEVDFVYEPIKKIVQIEALDDMNLELYKDDELVDSFSLNAQELKSYKLRYGNYTLIKAEPSRKTSAKVEFKIDENYDEEKVILLEADIGEEDILPNEPEQEPQNIVNIKLFDSNTKELISDNALFKIKNKETNEYLSQDDDDVFQAQNGLLVLKDLEIGTYEIEQIASPTGYRLTKEVASFKINAESVTLNVAIYQNKLSGSMIIKKSEALSLNPVAGALFAIYNSDKKLLFSEKTDEEGLLSLNNLDVGTYYVKEVLDGNLEFDDTSHEVEIKDNLISVVNFFDRITVSVPKTGVHDIKTPSIIGSGLITIGLILFKKREMA